MKLKLTAALSAAILLCAAAAAPAQTVPGDPESETPEMVRGIYRSAAMQAG